MGDSSFVSQTAHECEELQYICFSTIKTLSQLHKFQTALVK